MNLSSAVRILVIGVLSTTSQFADAQSEFLLRERVAARRELQLAKIDFRNYWQVEYPRIRRQLDAQIDLTEQEIRIYKERLRMYRPFDRFSTGSAFTLPIQELRMCLSEAELRLRHLWAERNNLIRFRTPEWRELELRVHEARLRVAEIEAAMESADSSELPSG